MRSIKFRCWDGKKMVTDTTEAFYDLNAHIRAFGGAYLMQFTGLKDKNGVEIYEGDIVMYANDYLSDCIPPEPPEPHNDFAVVQYSDLHTAFIGNAHHKNNHEKHATPLHLIIDEYGRLEIIGNIYENPELLEKAVTA